MLLRGSCCLVTSAKYADNDSNQLALVLRSQPCSPGKRSLQWDSGSGGTHSCRPGLCAQPLCSCSVPWSEHCGSGWCSQRGCNLWSRCQSPARALPDAPGRCLAGRASWASCGGFKRAPTAAFALGLVTRSTHICLVLIIIDKMWLIVRHAGAGLLLPATLLSLESPRREPLLLYLICALSLQQGAARVQPACCFPC